MFNPQPKPLKQVKKKETKGHLLWKKLEINRMVDEKGYAYCQRCFKGGRFLDCHHLVYQSEAPKHQHLNNPRNLIILCRDCHSYMHQAKSNRDYLIEERNLTELFGTQILSKKI
jgi:5-methylcytosine-specific restriction endonuclease McrA